MTMTPEAPTERPTTTPPVDITAMRGAFDGFHAALQRLRSRVRTSILIEGLSIVAIAFAVYFVMTWPVDRFFRLETPVRAVLLIVFACVLLWLLIRRCVQPLLFELADEELALAVERTNAPLGQRLISAMQFEQRFTRGEFRGDSPEMMQKVVGDLPAALEGVRFHDALRRDRIAKSWLYVVGGIGFLVLTGVLYAGFGLWAKRNLLLSSEEWPRATQLRVVGAVDGELVVPRGDDLTIEVDAEGVVPDALRVDYRFASGTRGSDTMTQNVGERRFRYTFPGVLEPMTFEAWGGDGVTGDVRVRLVDRPVLGSEDYRLVYPPYMKKDATVIDRETTQVTLPRGTEIHVTASSSKALARAALVIGERERAELEIGADGTTVRGKILPADSGLMKVELVDRDGLGEGPGRSLVVRVVPDKAPILRTRLRGLGSMISPKARIPIELEAIDDFGLESLRMVWAVDESAAIGTSPELDKKFEKSATEDLDRFSPGEVSFEGLVRHDLLPLIKNVEDLSAAENPVRPGSFVAVRFEAHDNDHASEEGGKTNDVGKSARSDSFTFKVVTEAELLRELNRRQGELRTQFEKIREAEIADRSEFAELMSPKAEGDVGIRVATRLATMARKQRSLAKRVQETAQRYGDVLDEMINNRVADGIGGEGRVRALRTAIVDRLEALGTAAMPALAGEISRYQRSGDPDHQRIATESFDEILRTMKRILDEMMKLESFTEVLTQLKDLIRLQDKTSKTTKKRLEDDLKALFGK
ncbi:MAG: hypothetical protein KDC95_01950 [Planctomycetes bacterium]|nr:hypothetical protein [Planctomycetota bacterium]